MARKETISKDDIKKAAFLMLREKGREEITARKLAEFAGCSTQPIFRNYSSMDECMSDVFKDALEYFDEFYRNFPKSSHIPFVNLGLCYIDFATKESNIFSYLFMFKNEYDYNLYTMLNGRTNALLIEMNNAKNDGVASPEQIFMKMWMLIHGAACMVITGDFDLTQTQTRLQLEDAYKAFVRH